MKTCTLPLALLLSGCIAAGDDGAAASYHLARTLRGSDVRCVVGEPDFTLTTPFGAHKTAELVTQVRRNLEAVEELLEVDVPASLVVRFEAVERPPIEVVMSEDGETWDVRGLDFTERHGYVGLAGSVGHDPFLLIFVVGPGRFTGADGDVGEASVTFDRTERTIRHELAHVAAFTAGLEGPTWFDEGLALELGYRVFADSGELVPEFRPVTLQTAVRERGRHDLATLLDWSEDVGRVEAGEEEHFSLGRPLAHAFTRFLLERTPGPSLRAQFEAIAQLDREALLALEPDFEAWLERRATGD